jgi:hypothetical protein
LFSREKQARKLVAKVFVKFWKSGYNLCLQIGQYHTLVREQIEQYHARVREQIEQYHARVREFPRYTE